MPFEVNSPDPSPGSAVPLLRVEALCKAFEDQSHRVEVLRGASLRIEAGQTLAITGQSGCGKSTLLNLLSGLESPDSGQIEWEGVAINRLGSKALAKMRGKFFGFIFQSFYLMQELTPLENVLFPARLIGRLQRDSRERAAHLLDQVGLGGRLRQPVQKLSGGERQRVAIARALMNEPGVVLADEPTGNLDEATAESIMELILHICAENRSSLILVTHNPRFAKLTQRQFLLHDGLIQET
jgi:ABC-type lipoprotein export system ATPase subunit